MRPLCLGCPPMQLAQGLYVPSAHLCKWPWPREVHSKLPAQEQYDINLLTFYV